MVRGQKETLFYTGDVCFGDQTILKGARFEDIKADVLIMETTRGNRQVPAGFTREAYWSASPKPSNAYSSAKVVS